MSPRCSSSSCRVCSRALKRRWRRKHLPNSSISYISDTDGRTICCSLCGLHRLSECLPMASVINARRCHCTRPPLHAAKKTQQPAASVFPRNRTFLIPFRLRHQQYARRADVLKFTYCSKNKKGGDRSKKRVSVTSLTLFVQFCERQDAQIRLLKKGAKEKH